MEVLVTLFLILLQRLQVIWTTPVMVFCILSSKSQSSKNILIIARCDSARERPHHGTAHTRIPLTGASRLGQ